MSNWMYNAISNGIGGIHAGSVEGDRKVRLGHKELAIKVEILDFLSGKYLDQAVRDGYVEKISTINKKERSVIEAYNHRIETERALLTRKIDGAKKAFIKKYFPEMKYSHKEFELATKIVATSSLKGEIKDDLWEIKSMISQRKNMPKKRKIPADRLRLTDKGYETYKHMFDVGVNKRYIYELDKGGDE